MNRDLISKYYQLSGISEIPDEIWNVQFLLDELKEDDLKRAQLILQLEEETSQMMTLLKTNWSDEDLVHAGLLV
jgi:hypothetical protein